MSPSNTPPLVDSQHLGPAYLADSQAQLQQLNTMLQMMRSVAYNSAPLSIPTGIVTAYTALTFDTNATQTPDYWGIHSVATNPTRFTAKASGLYLVQGQVIFTADPGGTFRGIRVRLNGAELVPLVAIRIAPVVGVGAATDMQISVPVYLNYTDYIEFFVQQDSGGPILVPATAAWGSLVLLSRL